MGMATHPLADGALTTRIMLSAEPWTIRGCGYPDLLATGELCQRDTIHDRQHPHDLFMEVAAAYTHRLRGATRWELYGGPAGEPALGPAGFPHRASAFPNPVAPIAHHWLDSTHITFGVVTAGVYGARWKIESSVFNGREPDPVRTNFDLGRMDAAAVRVSFAPTHRLTLQASAGHLPDAEAGAGTLPRTTVDRATASLSYSRTKDDRLWATTIAYGVNSQMTIIPGGVVPQTSHAVLIETALTATPGDNWFGRGEIVGKPAHDFHADEYARLILTVAKIEGGYTRMFRPRGGVATGVGGLGMFSMVPRLLAPRYGGRVTPGFGVFFTAHPQSSATK